MLNVILAFTLIINGDPLSVSTISRDSGLLIESQPIFRALHTTFEQYELTSGWQITTQGHQLILGPDSNYVIVDNELVSMSSTPVFLDGKCYLPVDFFETILAPLINARAQAGSQVMIIDTYAMDTISLTDIQLHYLSGFTKVVLSFDRSLPYDVTTDERSSRITLGSSLYSNQPRYSFDDPIVEEILVNARSINLRYRSGVRVSHYTLSNPFRIVLDISRTVMDTPGTHSETRKTILPSTSRPSRFTVVLDPGHGGKDAGALSDDGILTEKDLTLTVARKIEQILRDTYGYRVILTRIGDIDLDLRSRSAVANESQAHVFISIHANSAKIHNVKGAEVFYLTLDTMDVQAQLFAEEENMAQVKNNDIDFILWDLAQSANLTGSARLAEFVTRQISAATGLPERGVKQAPFKVLMGTTMPSILIELGFLSNQEDVTLLKQDAYLDRQAEAIAGAVVSFQKTMGDRWYGD